MQEEVRVGVGETVVFVLSREDGSPQLLGEGGSGWPSRTAEATPWALGIVVPSDAPTRRSDGTGADAAGNLHIQRLQPAPGRDVGATGFSPEEVGEFRNRHAQLALEVQATKEQLRAAKAASAGVSTPHGSSPAKVATKTEGVSGKRLIVKRYRAAPPPTKLPSSAGREGKSQVKRGPPGQTSASMSSGAAAKPHASDAAEVVGVRKKGGAMEPAQRTIQRRTEKRRTPAVPTATSASLESSVVESPSTSGTLPDPQSCQIAQLEEYVQLCEEEMTELTSILESNTASLTVADGVMYIYPRVGSGSSAGGVVSVPLRHILRVVREGDLPVVTMPCNSTVDRASPGASATAEGAGQPPTTTAVRVPANVAAEWTALALERVSADKGGEVELRRTPRGSIVVAIQERKQSLVQLRQQHVSRVAAKPLEPWRPGLASSGVQAGAPLNTQDSCGRNDAGGDPSETPRTDDPAQLRRRIEELEAKLARAFNATPAVGQLMLLEEELRATQRELSQAKEELERPRAQLAPLVLSTAQASPATMGDLVLRQEAPPGVRVVAKPAAPSCGSEDAQARRVDGDPVGWDSASMFSANSWMDDELCALQAVAHLEEQLTTAHERIAHLEHQLRERGTADDFGTSLRLLTAAAVPARKSEASSAASVSPLPPPVADHDGGVAASSHMEALRRALEAREQHVASLEQRLEASARASRAANKQLLRTEEQLNSEIHMRMKDQERIVSLQREVDALWQRFSAGADGTPPPPLTLSVDDVCVSPDESQEELQPLGRGAETAASPPAQAATPGEAAPHGAAWISSVPSERGPGGYPGLFDDLTLMEGDAQAMTIDQCRCLVGQLRREIFRARHQRDEAQSDNERLRFQLQLVTRKNDEDVRRRRAAREARKAVLDRLQQALKEQVVRQQEELEAIPNALAKSKRDIERVLRSS